jgi:hypothetical protein
VRPLEACYTGTEGLPGGAMSILPELRDCCACPAEGRLPSAEEGSCGTTFGPDLDEPNPAVAMLSPGT